MRTKIWMTIMAFVGLLLITACSGNIKAIDGISAAMDVANIKLAHDEIPKAKAALFTADLDEQEKTIVNDAINYAEMMVARYKSPTAVDMVLARTQLQDLAARYNSVFIVATDNWEELTPARQHQLTLYDISARESYEAVDDRLKALYAEGAKSIEVPEAESLMSMVLTVLRLAGTL